MNCYYKDIIQLGLLQNKKNKNNEMKSYILSFYELYLIL